MLKNLTSIKFIFDLVLLWQNILKNVVLKAIKREREREDFELNYNFGSSFAPFL